MQLDLHENYCHVVLFSTLILFQGLIIAEFTHRVPPVGSVGRIFLVELWARPQRRLYAGGVTLIPLSCLPLFFWSRVPTLVLGMNPTMYFFNITVFFLRNQRNACRRTA